MIIYDEILTWPEFSQELVGENECPRQCRIRIVKLNNAGTVSFLKKYYIVASDLGKDSGTSIRKSAQALIPVVCASHNIEIDEMVWFEHCPFEADDAKATLDVVTPKPIQSCCPSGCFMGVTVNFRPARINEVQHLKQFIPDIP